MEGDRSYVVGGSGQLPPPRQRMQRTKTASANTTQHTGTPIPSRVHQKGLVSRLLALSLFSFLSFFFSFFQPGGAGVKLPVAPGSEPARFGRSMTVKIA